MTLALGLMSGTSCDGVSLALCRFSGKKLQVLHHTDYPYPASILNPLKRSLELTTPEISKLHFSLGIYFADCAVRFLKSHHIPFSKIEVIGSHGQTLYHGPQDLPQNTLQIGEPSFLAEKIGAPVVSDFRPRDIAAGGSGAPLIPYFDHVFFSGSKNTALQNIGGIGNVTFLGKNGKTLAFDTGPGNCLIDLAVQKMTRGAFSYDAGGKIAAQGWIDQKAVRKMIRHPYFSQKPPKSTGRELFNQKFIDSYLKKLRPHDQIATLTFFTAYTIHESAVRFLPASLSELIVSGGGSKNKTLMKDLESLFAKTRVRTIEDWGIPTQAKEPAAFAFFALQALRGKINHEPKGTGANGARVLGKLTR